MIRKSAPFIVILLALAVMVAAAEKRYRLPSGDVDLVELTRTVAQITGFSFLHGKDFSGTAHLVINHEVTAKEAFDIYLSVLANAGFTTIEKGKVIKIVPRGTEVDPNLVFLKGEPIGPSDRRITVFIDLSHISSAQAAGALKNLVSPEGKLLASPSGNRIIVVDDAANVDRIRKAAAAMDVKGNRLKIEVIPLEKASAVAVANILSRLFPAVGKTRGTSFGERFTALPDLRTNAVIVQAPDREVAISRKLLKALDDPEASGAISVETLRNADAQSASELIHRFE